MKIALVHGINNSLKRSALSPLDAWLEKRGHDTLAVDLPERHWWNARWTTQKDAESTLEQIQSRWHDTREVMLVTHSRGALIANALERRAIFKGIVQFAPAASVGHRFLHQCPIFCVHSRSDGTLILGTMLPFGHPFGAAGRRGYDDPCVHNVEFKGMDHSSYFDKPFIDRSGGYVEYAGKLCGG